MHTIFARNGCGHPPLLRAAGGNAARCTGLVAIVVTLCCSAGADPRATESSVVTSVNTSAAGDHAKVVSQAPVGGPRSHQTEADLSKYSTQPNDTRAQVFLAG